MTTPHRLRRRARAASQSDWLIPVIAAVVAVLLGAVLLVAVTADRGLIPFSGTHWG